PRELPPIPAGPFGVTIVSTNAFTVYRFSSPALKSGLSDTRSCALATAPSTTSTNSVIAVLNLIELLPALSIANKLEISLILMIIRQLFLEAPHLWDLIVPA